MFWSLMIFNFLLPDPSLLLIVSSVVVVVWFSRFRFLISCVAFVVFVVVSWLLVVDVVEFLLMLLNLAICCCIVGFSASRVVVVVVVVAALATTFEILSCFNGPFLGPFFSLSSFLVALSSALACFSCIFPSSVLGQIIVDVVRLSPSHRGVVPRPAFFWSSFLGLGCLLLIELVHAELVAAYCAPLSTQLLLPGELHCGVLLGPQGPGPAGGFRGRLRGPSPSLLPPGQLGEGRGKHGTSGRLSRVC